MKQALLNMLEMQHRMNTRVHQDWISQRYEWYRAAWIECGELIDHYGYKWWKKQVPDLPQAQLEIIDIWHFGMSALITEEGDLERVANRILKDVSDYPVQGDGVREATEALALYCLEHKSFSPTRFWELMAAADMDFGQLYSAYVGKNVLNFFRQDHGYKDGSYIKQWQGREDNEHLVELVASLDTNCADFADQVYASLERRYAECCA